MHRNKQHKAEDTYYLRFLLAKKPPLYSLIGISDSLTAHQRAKYAALYLAKLSPEDRETVLECILDKE